MRAQITWHNECELDPRVSAGPSRHGAAGCLVGPGGVLSGSARGPYGIRVPPPNAVLTPPGSPTGSINAVILFPFPIR